MCGIAGLAGGPAVVAGADGGRVDRAVLGALAHRGPDGSGTYGGGTVLHPWRLHHTRLSIVDLSEAGAQPMAAEGERFWITFNGEIYNYPELRRRCEAVGHRFRSNCDTEVILHLWQDEGWHCLRHLDGIYALAVGDNETGELILARDPFGVKPLFWSAAGSDLWFASELTALAAAGAPMGGPDTTALAQFLTFLWIPDPLTPHSGARSLEPGAVLHWTSAGVTHLRHSDLVNEALGAVPATAAESATARGRRLIAGSKDTVPPPFSEAARTLLVKAVDRQLQADVPVRLLASGGIDSSLLWWAAGSRLEEALTIQWQESDGDERLDEDAAAVRLLEAETGTPVDYFDGGIDDLADLAAPPPSGDLFADPAAGLLGALAARTAARGGKVLLSGQGGDEVFAGYRRHQLAPWLGTGGRLTDAFRPAARHMAERLERRGGGTRLEYVSRLSRAASSSDPLHRYMTLCSYSTSVDRARTLGCAEREVTDEVVWQRHRAVDDRLPASWSPLRRALFLDLAVYLPGLGLAYADRAGMAAGVEVRVPFLDPALVRFSFSLPDSILLRTSEAKRVPKAIARQVLPTGLADRPKRGFGVPTRVVQRAQRDAVRDTAPPAGERGFRQGSYLGLAQRVLANHLAGR